jgi:hypothetical protein
MNPAADERPTGIGEAPISRLKASGRRVAGLV